jgi:hypothetical protein
MRTTDVQRVDKAMKIRSNWATVIGGCFVAFGLLIVAWATGQAMHKDEVAKSILIWFQLSGYGVVIAIAGLLWTRPAIVMSDRGLLFRQSLRDHWIPWSAIRDTDVRRRISVDYVASNGESRKAVSGLFSGSGRHAFGTYRKREKTLAHIERYRAHYADAPAFKTPHRPWSRISLAAAGFAALWFFTAAITAMATS